MDYVELKKEFYNFYLRNRKKSFDIRTKKGTQDAIWAGLFAGVVRAEFEPREIHDGLKYGIIKKDHIMYEGICRAVFYYALEQMHQRSFFKRLLERIKNGFNFRRK